LKPLESIFGRFSKPLQTKFEFDFIFKHKDPRLVIPFSSFLFYKPTRRERKDLLEIFFWSPKIFANLSFCRLQFGLEGRGKPEALPAFHPSSLYSSTWSIH
jgi:hypothetical protein